MTKKCLARAFFGHASATIVEKPASNLEGRGLSGHWNLQAVNNGSDPDRPVVSGRSAASDQDLGRCQDDKGEVASTCQHQEAGREYDLVHILPLSCFVLPETIVLK
jgi:hypothetical protein